MGEDRDKKGLSRRGFLKGAAVAVAGVAGAATAAETVVSALPSPDAQGQYMKDVLPGDSALAKMEYVPMSNEEKKELIGFFEKSHKENA